MSGISPAAQKQQACEPCGLISLSCRSACCLLSITEWVYHISDGVSTIVVRRAEAHDGWVAPSDTGQLAETRDPSLSKMDQITPATPCSVWLCIGRMKYACIVYLRKSISFAHLQINRYNGIADIDLSSLQHSQ
ncbi:hypothetical protein JOB18_008449 [Solea senegalensis]|uniref:Uncharacterized protein n=1 Tax=Solea senegalensis TaxID=28829 RepID=A0AAV6Q343_SOLSE|nr:hypothetical protein JOB18_008449 [Solea senegalensis]